MPYAKLRLGAFINRFGTLRRAREGFAGAPPGSFVRRKLFGQNIDLDISRSTAQQLLFLEGERFVEERFLLRGLLKPGMRVVDVGANIGYYLLLFQQAVGPGGGVVCIEPSAENLPELRRNISINGMHNVELHEVALGEHEGRVGLHSGINSGVTEGTVDAPYEVPLRRLDTLVNAPVDFVKIDVEGYEGQVLAGAERILVRRPVLFLELHPHIVGRFGYTVRRILEGLARHYSRITLFEKEPDAALSHKIAVRYFGRDPMRRVEDADAYVRRFDAGNIPHTYWAVCQP